jgi:hypothetical protein
MTERTPRSYHNAGKEKADAGGIRMRATRDEAKTKFQETESAYKCQGIQPIEAHVAKRKSKDKGVYYDSPDQRKKAHISPHGAHASCKLQRNSVSQLQRRDLLLPLVSPTVVV